jgi:succinate dehydrogenase/fumarate reductase flavoprotein subunit
VLKDIEENELPQACADNPHKLMRLTEVSNILTVDEMIIHASLARRASNSHLSFDRLDYPVVDPPEWNTWVTIQQEGGNVEVGDLPLDFHGDVTENYEKNCGL